MTGPGNDGDSTVQVCEVTPTTWPWTTVSDAANSRWSLRNTRSTHVSSGTGVSGPLPFERALNWYARVTSCSIWSASRCESFAANCCEISLFNSGASLWTWHRGARDENGSRTRRPEVQAATVEPSERVRSVRFILLASKSVRRGGRGVIMARSVRFAGMQVRRNAGLLVSFEVLDLAFVLFCSLK